MRVGNAVYSTYSKSNQNQWENYGDKIKTGLKNQTLSILNTYAPNMGYHIDQINAYWTTLNQYINTIPRTHIRMWCADNNGQISNINNSNDNNIGPWTN